MNRIIVLVLALILTMTLTVGLSSGTIEVSAECGDEDAIVIMLPNNSDGESRCVGMIVDDPSPF